MTAVATGVAFAAPPVDGIPNPYVFSVYTVRISCGPGIEALPATRALSVHFRLSAPANGARRADTPI
jgi:hypothetical protein